MRGPPKQPTALKLLHGETRPSRIGGSEPQPREQLPEAPTWLSLDAQMIWRRTIEELDHMGLAFAADQDQLAVYVNAVVNYSKAQQLLDQSGVLVVRKGRAVRNPANTVAQANAAIIHRYAREFGLTPSARVNLASPAEPESERELAARLLS